MNLKEFAYKKLKLQSKKKKNEQYKLKKGVDAVQNVYEESETKKEANEKAINIVINTIQAHPDMPVGEFLKMIQEETELSDHSLVEIIKQMPDIKSEKATVDAVKKVELAPEAITEIIQKAPVSPVIAQKLVEQIPDEDIQKEQQAEINKRLEEEKKQKLLEEERKTISELDNLYNICEKLNDTELIDKINEIGISTKTEKINECLNNIIAKKVALDHMEFGGPKLPTMMKVMQATDMLEVNLPDLVEKEYQKIKTIYDEKGKKYHKYDEEGKKLLKRKILENIAKEVANNFEEIGDISVPQIKSLKNLNEEEVNIFVNAVKNHVSKSKIAKDDVEMIRKQLKGDTVGEWKKLKRILERMKPNDREKAVNKFLQLLKINKSKTEEQKELDYIIDDIEIGIRKLPSDKQIDSAKAIVNILEQKYQAIERGKKHQEQELGK